MWIIIMATTDNLHGSIVPRAVAPLLETALRTMRVVVVTGPRQAGKSTLVRSHPELVARPYFSLDAAATLLRVQADRDAFLRSEPEMIIDEVQRDRALMLAIKVAGGVRSSCRADYAASRDSKR
jgi:predicted AAA+ superfamily ATPase